jgi:Fe-Mn family superoxide dismutase
MDVIDASRRAILGALAAGAASALPTPLQAQAPLPEKARAYRGEHQPKPLPFDPTKLQGLSERLVRSHWENNYGGAVKALNAVEQRLAATLADPDLPPYLYGDWKREELVRTGSVVLHEHYFANLGGDGRPSGSAAALLKEWFGSVEAWEAEFRRTGMALSGGSGWVVLARNLQTGAVHNYWLWDHQHQPAMAVPLLVLDMYEHAYHMDYGAAAAKYLDAFFRNVQWDEVIRRVEWSAKITPPGPRP